MVQEILRRIKEQRYRMTVSRRWIIEILSQQGCPMLARDILKQLRTVNKHADKSTVYRELNFFVDQGFVRVVGWADGVNRFELIPDQHHHHVVCSQCKRSEEIVVDTACLVQEQKVSRATKFKVFDHSFEFFGLCGQCQ